ncbi:MAG TPA: hypothetical protein VGK54_17370, partial [Chloroflexota bacterium]
MTEHVEAELGGQRYVWNGRRWKGAEDHHVPPRPVLQSLNRLRKRAGRSTDQALTDPGKLIALAVGARSAGDPGRAERLARRVLSIEPGNGIAAAIVSSILRAKGNPRRALAIVDHFRASNDPPVLTSRAAALCDLRCWDEALQQIREVLAIEVKAYGGGSDE